MKILAIVQKDVVNLYRYDFSMNRWDYFTCIYGGVFELFIIDDWFCLWVKNKHDECTPIFVDLIQKGD